MEFQISNRYKATRFVCVFCLALFALSCFGRDDDQYVIVHEPVDVYRSLDELGKSSVLGNEDIKPTIVLSGGDRVDVVDSGYAKSFMYIHVRTKEGGEGYIYNSPEITIVEVAQ